MRPWVSFRILLVSSQRHAPLTLLRTSRRFAPQFTRLDSRARSISAGTSHALRSRTSLINTVTSKRSAKRKVVTLADLAPRHDVHGGSGRRVFGAEPSPTHDGTVKDHTAAGTRNTTKDLPAKNNPKLPSKR